MFLKRKQRAKLKAKGCTEGRYYRIFNHKIKSSLALVHSNTHKGCRMLNTNDYNYKLRSVLWQEDNVTTNKWTWFDTQVRAIFSCFWMISLVLADYTDIRGIIGCILDDVLSPHMSMNNSIGSVTSYSHVSMVVHSWSNNHLQLRNLIHGNILSSSSKKQWNGNVSLKNGVIGVDYKMTINMLIKILYIAIQYFYMTDQLIYGDISRAIYKPTKILKSNYFTQVIEGKLININQLKWTKVNIIKSIGSKWVRL